MGAGGKAPRVSARPRFSALALGGEEVDVTLGEGDY